MSKVSNVFYERHMQANIPTVNLSFITLKYEKPMAVYSITFCLLYSVWHPNPHCFIAITKAAARGWKDLLLPHPLHTQPCRGEGAGVDHSEALEICLIKTLVTLQLSPKAHWKLHFYWTPLKQKSFLSYGKWITWNKRGREVNDFEQEL
jgi:hypothetical protein